MAEWPYEESSLQKERLTALEEALRRDLKTARYCRQSPTITHELKDGGRWMSMDLVDYGKCRWCEKDVPVFLFEDESDESRVERYKKNTELHAGNRLWLVNGFFAPVAERLCKFVAEEHGYIVFTPDDHPKDFHGQRLAYTDHLGEVVAVVGFIAGDERGFPIAETCSLFPAYRSMYLKGLRNGTLRHAVQITQLAIRKDLRGDPEHRLLTLLIRALVALNANGAKIDRWYAAIPPRLIGLLRDQIKLPFEPIGIPESVLAPHETIIPMVLMREDLTTKLPTANPKLWTLLNSADPLPWHEPRCKCPPGSSLFND